MASSANGVIFGVLSLFICLSLVVVTRVIIARSQLYPWDLPVMKNHGIMPLDNFNDRAERLAKALTIKTISSEDSSDLEGFLELHQYFKESFPLVHSSPNVKRSVINQYSLLYEIQGKTNTSIPYMLAAHLDVVPVSNETWKIAEPFEGKIVDGNIVGRGALDDKSSVLGILEALEFLLENSYEFERSFYIGFGHDEEISGFEGAGHIAKHLRGRGVDKLDFVLDEGYFVLQNFVQGVDELVSVIGVTEKGYATLELSADLEPGHSSIPLKETAISVISKAVVALNDNPHPALFGAGPEADFFSYLSSATHFGQSIIFSNLWLFGPLLSLIISQNPATDSIQRTTTAVTMIHGGYKSNVIPGTATAIVNHRIHPVETLEEVIERNHKIIKDDRVKIKVLEYYPPTSVSPYGPEVEQFNLIAKTVKEIYPTSVITPACSPANTDLRRYTEFTQHLYRILPSIITPETRTGIHGDDEQISVEQYANLIKFYVSFMMNADKSYSNFLPPRQKRRDL